MGSSSYGRLPTTAQIDRIDRLLNTTKGRIVRRGEVDREAGKIGISIVCDVMEGDILLEEEVFGPIVVVSTVQVSFDASLLLSCLAADSCLPAVPFPRHRVSRRLSGESTPELLRSVSTSSRRTRRSRITVRPPSLSRCLSFLPSPPQADFLSPPFLQS